MHRYEVNAVGRECGTRTELQIVASLCATIKKI